MIILPRTELLVFSLHGAGSRFSRASGLASRCTCSAAECSTSASTSPPKITAVSTPMTALLGTHFVLNDVDTTISQRLHASNNPLYIAHTVQESSLVRCSMKNKLRITVASIAMMLLLGVPSLAQSPQARAAARQAAADQPKMRE